MCKISLRITIEGCIVFLQSSLTCSRWNEREIPLGTCASPGYVEKDKNRNGMDTLHSHHSLLTIMSYFRSRSIALQVDSVQIGVHTAMVMTFEVDDTRVHAASPLSLPPTPLGVSESPVDSTPMAEQIVIASTVPHTIITLDDDNDIVLETGPEVIVLDDDPIVII